MIRSLCLSPERWARLFGVATLAGLEFGLLGPFGSYLANPFTRIAYWTALFWAGALILVPLVSAGVARGSRRGFPPLFSGSVAALLACVPLALLAAVGCYGFWPVHAAGIRIPEWYGSTVVVALPCVAGWLWLDRSVGSTRLAPASMGEAPAAVAMPPPREAIMGIPGPVLALAHCLEMEDHHVRVHLPHGSTLYLAAMRDAVAAVGSDRGLQVHRSWWVARAAVRGWEQDGRAVTLVLENGSRVPVARQRVAHLRADGWLG